MTAQLYPEGRDPRVGQRALRLVSNDESGPTTKRTVYQRVFKRPFDVLVGGALLLATAPIMAGVAAAIRLRMGRQVLFRQDRIGLDGEVFTITKFRTMGHDRRNDPGDFDGPDRRQTHKTTDDPRHTELGAFLRKYALDELPQLINVLRGEMSMVGPRPELASVAHDHGIVEHVRHTVRPGITGPWQLSGSRDEHIAENLHFDEGYVPQGHPSWRYWLHLPHPWALPSPDWVLAPHRALLAERSPATAPG